MDNPFTEEQLDELSDFITIVREQFNRVLLRISATNKEVASADNNLSKAFDSMNDATKFLNVALAHADYAHKFVQKGMEVYHESQSKAVEASADCECEPRQGCVL